MAAAVAMQAKEAMFSDTASEIIPELAFNEARQRPLPFLTERQEGLELFGDDLIQNCLFGIPWSVFRFAAHARAERSIDSRS